MAETTTTQDAPEPLIGTQPKGPTPLEVAEIYYNKRWRVPPVVVTTQEQKDALDPAEWTLDPVHTEPPAGPVADQYPKLMFNVNVSPRIVSSPEEETSLGGDYREFSISEALIKAAQAKLDAAAKEKS